MVRKIFNGRAIAAAGPLPGQLSVEKLKVWTKLRGAVFSDTVDENTTHLLCTEEQFRRRRKNPKVKEALKKWKKLHVVHYDWYELSCTENKKLSEREYSMRTALAQEMAKKREEERAERGRREGERFVNTNYFHIYHDREAFPYRITLTRLDEDGETNRYELTLWASHAEPHLYHFTAKYLKKRGASKPTYWRPSPCAEEWRPQMNYFMQFFQIKTGIAWEDRVMDQGTKGPERFQYQPPTGGKPVGRRLRLPYEECRKINAMQRGLSWPPVEEEPMKAEKESEGLSNLQSDDEGIDVYGHTEQPEAGASATERLEPVKLGTEAEDIEMSGADSGVSDCQLNDGDVEMGDAENVLSALGWDDGPNDDAPQDPKSGVNDDSDGSNSAVWMEVKDFISKMNGILAVARERILCADDSILEARNALPGFLEGHLKYYSDEDNSSQSGREAEEEAGVRMSFR